MSSQKPGPRSGPPPQAPQVDNRRERTRLKHTMAEVFEKEGIEEGSTEIEEKMEPGRICQSQAKFTTNAFGVKMKKNVPLFKYHIEINASRERQRKEIFLTKRSNDDCIAADRKSRCRDAFLLMKDVCHDLFSLDVNYYYDLQSTLVTTARFPHQELRFPIRQPALSRFPSLANFDEIRIHIKQCETEADGSTSDMRMASISNYENFDRSHQAFIELATSQHALFSPTDVICLSGGKMYLIAPQEHINEAVVNRCNNFAADKFIGIGVKKSAKYIEGPKGRGHENVALFIDPLKTAFFRGQTVAELLRSKGVRLDDHRAVSRFMWLLKGLHVFNRHLGAKRPFQITGLSRATPRTHQFKLRDGTPTNVEEYFYNTYHVDYVDPNAPMVMGKGKNELLPLDHAMIDDNQPVPKNKMQQREDADMIVISAQPPSAVQNEINGYVKALGLHEMDVERNNIAIIPNRLNVDGRILEKPELQFAQNNAAVPNAEGIWNLQGKKFIRGSKVSKWGMLKHGDEQVNMAQYQDAFVRMCHRVGVELPPKPSLEGKIQDDLEEWFQKAKQENIEFLAFITDKSIKSQGELKMLERKYGITTQNVTPKVANDAAGRGTATLENIVCKTNPKLGGTNYAIRHNQPFIDEAFGDRCIIIGVALSHAGSIDDVQRARGGPLQTTNLSSVGYAANTGRDKYEFIGDYAPNNPHRSEILEIIPGIIRASLAKYRENKGHEPTTMLLYLNGNSEGEFAMLKRFEIPLILREMEQSIGHRIPLTVIVPQRSHMARIMRINPNPKDKGPAQNLPVGVVVDTGLVHPKLNEFYLNSHVAIQGTARTPKYTILHNDNENARMDAMQHITYYLCYGHQIIPSPTSLPAPVYCAMDYAERGSKMIKAIGTQDPNVIIESWTYETSEEFRNVRVNA